MYLRVGSYVDRILKGAYPGDLPVQDPTKYVLAINLKPQRRSASPCRSRYWLEPTRSSNRLVAQRQLRGTSGRSPMRASMTRLRRHRSFASKDGQVAAFNTMSAAFSPIMIDGALVLPDVSVGMIEASAIRRPTMPWTRSWASTTAIGSDPILQVPTGW